MGRVTKIFFLFWIFIFTGIVKSSSQNINEDSGNLLIEDQWSSGRVILTDNTVYKGQINYQENFDLIRVKASGKIKTFTPKQVQNFSFYDAVEKQERFFIPIPYESGNKFTTLIFFEVLKETKDVALLSRRFHLNKGFSKGFADNLTPLTILTPYSGSYIIPGSFGPPTSLNYKSVTNRETLFLANDKGSIEPFVVIAYKNIEPDKRRLLDRSLMREFLGDSYRECKEFVDRYELDLKDKDDLMALLDYYERIE